MRRLGFVLLFLVLLIGIVSSQVWAVGAQIKVEPTREIRFIVPYEPGGLSDITARIIERIIRTKGLLDVPFVVTNIPGASAGNGMIAVRDAEPDGHTLLYHHTSFITHKVFGVRDWGFEEFKPVALLFEVPCVLFTYPGRYESLQEWIDDVKSNPGRTSISVSSLGGNAHLFAEQVLNTLGIRDDVNLAAYGAGGPMFTAMLGKEDDISVAPLPQAMGYHKSGDMIILATGSDERLPFLPDIPTLKELGINIAMAVAYRMGVWAPKNTPDEIVQNRYELFQQVINSDEFLEEAEGQGVFPNFRDGDYLVQIFKSDEEIISKLVMDLGLNK